MLLVLLLVASLFVACQDNNETPVDTTGNEDTSSEGTTSTENDSSSDSDTDTTGSDTTGSDTTGSDTTGSDTTGSDTTGSDQTTSDGDSSTDEGDTSDGEDVSTADTIPEYSTDALELLEHTMSWTSVYKNEKGVLADCHPFKEGSSTERLDGGAAANLSYKPMSYDESWNIIYVAGWAGSGDKDNPFVAFGYRINLNDVVVVPDAYTAFEGEDIENIAVARGGDAKFCVPIPAPTQNVNTFIRAYGICQDGTKVAILSFWVKGTQEINFPTISDTVKFNYTNVKAGSTAITGNDISTVTINPGEKISFTDGWIGLGQPIVAFGYRLDSHDDFKWVEGSAVAAKATDDICKPENGGTNATYWKNVVSAPFDKTGMFLFEFAAKLDDGTVKIIHSFDVVVASIKASSATYDKGASITVTSSSENPNGDNRIAIYKADEVPSNALPPIAWFLANSNETAFVPNKAVSLGYFVERPEENHFPVGKYTIYLFEGNTYRVLASTNIEITGEPETETVPVMWDKNKDIIAHLSFDELRKNGSTDSAQGVFTPGDASKWNKVATLTDETYYLDFWGWVGIKSTTWGEFGFQIDDKAAVYDSTYKYESDENASLVKHESAVAAGAKDASRMLIRIDFSGMTEGEHTVKTLYKDATGKVVILGQFSVKYTAA